VHVHETVDEAGRHAAVAHSHAEEHHHHAAAARTGLLEIEDEESVVVSLDPVFVVASSYSTPAPVASALRVLEPPAVVTHLAPAPFVERLNHGPPRAPTPLRGPPATHS